VAGKKFSKFSPIFISTFNPAASWLFRNFCLQFAASLWGTPLAQKKKKSPVSSPLNVLESMRANL